MAARRARQLAPLRSPGGDRGRHRVREDGRRHRRRRRLAAPGPLRAGGRAVTGAHGAVARSAHRRVPGGPDRPAGRQRHRPPDDLRRARGDPALRGGPQAGATGRRRWAAHRRRVPRPRRTDAAPSDAPAVRRAARPHRHARTQRRRRDRAARAVLRRDLPPLRVRAGHRRRGVRPAAGGAGRGRAERRGAGRVHRHGAAARERPPPPASGAGDAARPVRGLPRRGGAPRRARRRRRRPRRPRVPRRVLQAAGDRGAVEREVRAARPPRQRHPRRAGGVGVHGDGARREPRHQPAGSATSRST